MWLFEVHDSPRPGFRLNLRSGAVGVSMGYDEKTNGESWLPIGNSIEQALTHPDDQHIPFELLRAKLEDKTSGLCLVKQTEEEARAECRALVLVDGCIDHEVGVTNIAEAYDRQKPELITYVKGDGSMRRLYVFKPGDALFISWSARALNSNRPKRFIIAWEEVELTYENGETYHDFRLTETAVKRLRRNPQRPKTQREKKRRSAVVRQELRP